jgi:hypothetical protein
MALTPEELKELGLEGWTAGEPEIIELPKPQYSGYIRSTSGIPIVYLGTDLPYGHSVVLEEGDDVRVTVHNGKMYVEEGKSLQEKI